MFTTLQTESPLISSKLRLLYSYDFVDTAFELKRLNLDSIQFEGLFERRKLGSYSSYAMGHGGGSGTGGNHSNGGNTVVQPVLQRRSTPVSMIGNGGAGGGGATPGKKKSYINGGNTSGGESNPLVVVKDSAKVIKLQPIDPSKVCSSSFPFRSVYDSVVYVYIFIRRH